MVDSEIGSIDGSVVGSGLGLFVGPGVGDLVGCCVGSKDGAGVGSSVSAVGLGAYVDVVGSRVGASVGQTMCTVYSPDVKAPCPYGINILFPNFWVLLVNLLPNSWANVKGICKRPR